MTDLEEQRRAVERLEALADRAAYAAVQAQGSIQMSADEVARLQAYVRELRDRVEDATRRQGDA